MWRVCTLKFEMLLFRISGQTSMKTGPDFRMIEYCVSEIIKLFNNRQVL